MRFFIPWCNENSSKYDYMMNLHNVDIIDISHMLTENINLFFLRNKTFARIALIINSIMLDIVAICFAFHIIMNSDYIYLFPLFCSYLVRAFMVFTFRIKVPRNMIWFNTGFPSITVDYRTQDDFFFSGHSMSSCYMMLYFCFVSDAEYLKYLSMVTMIYTILILIFFRAHYFADIYAGVITAIAGFLLVPYYL